MKSLRTMYLAGRQALPTPHLRKIVPLQEKVLLRECGRIKTSAVRAGCPMDTVEGAMGKWKDRIRITRKMKHTLVWCSQRSNLEIGLPFRDPEPKTPAWVVQRSFHCSTSVSSFKLTSSPEEGDKKQDKGSSSLVTNEDLFEKASHISKSKATFNQVLDIFCKKDIRRRGHVEFIYAALKMMPEFGVERDLAVYNKLLDVFPKEVFVARNYIQRMFNHYPRQQECAVEVLEQMENYGIMPNKDTKFLLLQIFGDKSHPIRKYQRLMYWFPRFKHANPYPLPAVLPQDPLDLARLSLQRIATDLDAHTTVYQMPSSEDISEHEGVKQPYIIGIQSPDQRCLLAKHNSERPVIVEGPFPLWLKATRVFYYVLRADPLPPEEKREKELDPERNLYYPMTLDLQLERDFGDDDSFFVDEVDEGPVFAMCMAGSGDQVTLARWISGLQETNPVLGRTSVVFRLESGPREIQAGTEPEMHRDFEELQSQKMTQ